MSNVHQLRPRNPVATDGEMPHAESFANGSQHSQRITNGSGSTPLPPGTNGDLPDPIAPEWLDVRSADCMMLHTEMLLNSDTWAIATGDEAKAAMTLWAKSFHQVPAGTLPNDDRILAIWSMAGTVEKWLQVKDVALRNWILCSDNRYHHQVIIAMAEHAFEFYQARKRGGQARWHNAKTEQNQRAGRKNKLSSSPAPAEDKPSLSNLNLNLNLTPSKEEGVPVSAKKANKINERQTRIMADAVDSWNEICGTAGCPTVRKLTDAREARLRKRLAELDWELMAWRDLCGKVAASAFCRGDNDRGWPANFDWMLQPASLIKLAEGFYDDRPAKAAPKAKPKPYRGIVEKF